MKEWIKKWMSLKECNSINLIEWMWGNEWANKREWVKKMYVCMNKFEKN